LSETRGKRRSRKHDERAEVGLFEVLHMSARAGEKWGVRVAGSECKVVKGERGRQAHGEGEGEASKRASENSLGSEAKR
jgi:hypothetical protein